MTLVSSLPPGNNTCLANLPAWHRLGASYSTWEETKPLGAAWQAAGKSGGGGQDTGGAVGVRRAKQSVQAGQGLLGPETRPGGCASPGVWEAVSLLPWTSRARRSPRFWDLGAPGVRGGARVASQNGQKALSARFGKFKEVFQGNSEASGCRWWPSGRPGGEAAAPAGEPLGRRAQSAPRARR